MRKDLDAETRKEPTPADSKKEEGRPVQQQSIPPESKAKVGSLKPGSANLAKGMAVGAGGVGLLGLSLGAVRGKPGGEGVAPHHGQAATPEQAAGQIPVAQGDYEDLPFDKAFADAHAQVGSGGIFIWHGNVYNTYYEGEWASMTPEEKRQFFSALSGHVEPPDGTEDIDSTEVTEGSESSESIEGTEPSEEFVGPPEELAGTDGEVNLVTDDPTVDYGDGGYATDPGDPIEDPTVEHSGDGIASDLEDPTVEHDGGGIASGLEDPTVEHDGGGIASGLEDPTVEHGGDDSIHSGHDVNDGHDGHDGYDGHGSFGDSGGSTLDMLEHVHYADFDNHADVGAFDHAELL